MKSIIGPMGCVVACLALSCAPHVEASDWYAGVAGGVSRADVTALQQNYAQNFVQQNALGTTANQVISSSSSERRGAWKALVGVKPTEFVAIELSFSKYGKQEFGFTGRIDRLVGSPAFGSRISARAERDVAVWGVDVLGVLPIAPTVELFGGVGAASAQVKVKTEELNVGLLTFTNVNDDSESKTVARLTLGGTWKPSPGWGCVSVTSTSAKLKPRLARQTNGRLPNQRSRRCGFRPSSRSRYCFAGGAFVHEGMVRQ